MTFYTVFKVSKLCSCRFPSFAHCHAARYRAYCPLLYRQSLAVSTAYLCRAATSDTDSSEVTKTRTVRWLPRSRKKKVIFKSSPLVNDPPASVLVDVLPSRECVGTDLQNTPLNTARTEVDEKLKELEEIASIQIPDIQLAVELENENTEEEPAEKTEVCNLIFPSTITYSMHVHGCKLLPGVIYCVQDCVHFFSSRSAADIGASA